MYGRSPTMLMSILLAFGTLLPIANPLSTAFVFNTLARGRSIEERRRIALIASLTAAVVLLTFLFIGPYLLTFFGITIYAFRAAGGLYLGKIAFEMLSSDLHNDPEAYTTGRDDIAIIPLAIPLLSGPGSITAVLVLADGSSPIVFGVVATAIMLVALLAWLFLRHAHHLNKVFGELGTKALERILGLIVLVIAVQFLFNGVSGYLESIGMSLF